ncbi:general secretion pathway protein GspC [Pseudomonas sp. S35]|uniref:general secretion pathway protein GspC n=1 Tax=Pseudomonas sp. S35 TaxID=1573719 RepID=UPI00132EAD47|nr:general secretion pathway protein GspC [Pseudomonas sp. S35]QHF45073.1 general secretion pathway protein GspC [Pseudomonas sp. S35]
MAYTFRLSPAQLLQSAALLAALAGVLVWSSLLLTPAQSSPSPTEREGAPAAVDSPALQWFSNRPVVMDLKVSGVMTSAHGAVAILSLNGAPARGFLAGERLSQGVRVVAIERDAVVIERGDERARFKISTLPDAPLMPPLTRP